MRAVDPDIDRLLGDIPDCVGCLLDDTVDAQKRFLLTAICPTHPQYVVVVGNYPLTDILEMGDKKGGGW